MYSSPYQYANEYEHACACHGVRISNREREGGREGGREREP